MAKRPTLNTTVTKNAESVIPGQAVSGEATRYGEGARVYSERSELCPILAVPVCRESYPARAQL
eukprot:11165344-Alexandrium_andersonii.AAC.1